jgi:TM2 domain-containing membrane protein YozV
MKTRRTALILSIFLGEFGIDRFYLGYIGTGILKLITVGGLGIWYMIDIIQIALGNMKTKDGQSLV